MNRGDLLHRGKVKSVWLTDDPGFCIAEFSDTITAGDGAKRDELAGKGALLNSISSIIFERLAEKGVDSHFVRKLSDTEMLVRRAELFALEVVVRNRSAGSLCRRLGLEPNMEIKPPLVEFFYKNDELGDPLLTKDHIRMLNLAEESQVADMERQALAVNQALQQIFGAAGLDLVDFKLEFGLADGKVLLIDEISPDTCRLWVKGTTEGLDKDRFRQDSGDVLAGYREVLRRLEEGA